MQVYTHPLWMLCMTLGAALTGEVFWTSIALSFLFALAAVWISARTLTRGFRDDLWKAPLVLVVLLASKAALDYTGSGLENVLSYLLAAVFYARLVALCRAGDPAVPERVAPLVLIASLAFVNRYDTLLLYLPALAFVAPALRRYPPTQLLRLAVLATLPATLWLTFALFYYGFVAPNTAHAKMLGTGFPLAWSVQRGFEYAVNSVQWDPASWVVLAGSMLLAVRRRSAPALCLLGGVVLYLIYIVVSAGAATHMSGRFFALPFFVVAVLFVDCLVQPRSAAVVAVALGIFMAWSPVAALKFATPAYHSYEQQQNHIDTKWFVRRHGAALSSWRPGRKLPDHTAYHYGARLREKPQRAHIGGTHGQEAIGFVGYAAGPETHFIDKVGLGDPLLARLPALRPANIADWKSGHYHRAIPPGYLKSIARDENHLVDPDLRRYYTALRLVTRGPLFSVERLAVVWDFQLGRYDHLLPDPPSSP